MIRKVLILAATLSLAACTRIDTGNVGVEKTLGQINKEILPAGNHVTGLKSYIEVSGKELLLKMDDMKPQTSDKITLQDLDVDIYVQIDTSKAPEIMSRWPNDLFTPDGEDGARLGMGYVTRQAREKVYDAVTKFGSATVHTERTALAAEIVKTLQADLDASAGKGWFFVRSANVRSLVTDQALEKNIREAAAAQFELAKKENQIKVARAEAERKRVEAQGDADAIRVRSQAIAAQGGAEYVQLQAIEKWDGKLPATVAGGATPFIHVK